MACTELPNLHSGREFHSRTQRKPGSSVTSEYAGYAESAELREKRVLSNSHLVAKVLVHFWVE